ncbi:MAG: hypothetical protein HPM95_16355 [Alphaproteobacteria bacterium]|nr:hypothetical protein [Alphaproteobacteria bacterium]
MDCATRADGFLFKFIQPHDVRRSACLSGKAGPHGKGLLMTFDLERYRAHIALNLPREQEDELLRDLWSMTEALVDQSFTARLTPAIGDHETGF